MIKNVKFVLSAGKAQQFICDGKAQFAFVGRSNCGKSSLINSLCNQQIAKTSSTPGHTKLVNYFLIDDKFYFVDLPGYGFHKTAKANESVWVELIEKFFMENKNLKMIFVLLDIRHLPSEEDVDMVNFLNYYQIPYIIVATKSDKLSKAQQGVAKQKLAQALKLGIDNIIISSAQNKTGKAEIECVLKLNK